MGIFSTVLKVRGGNSILDLVRISHETLLCIYVLLSFLVSVTTNVTKWEFQGFLFSGGSWVPQNSGIGHFFSIFEKIRKLEKLPRRQASPTLQQFAHTLMSEFLKCYWHIKQGQILQVSQEYFKA